MNLRHAHGVVVFWLPVFFDENCAREDAWPERQRRLNVLNNLNGNLWSE